MRWQRAIIYAVFLLALTAALAGWQIHEYGHECALARQTLERQADSVMKALVGGIRSHRRLGPFFEEQLQGAMDELALSEDVLVVEVVSADGLYRRFAGDEGLLDSPVSLDAGDSWQPDAFRSVVTFHLEPDDGEGTFGTGGGRGWGRALRQEALGEAENGMSAGGDYAAVLLLDRKPTDMFCRRAFWLRLWVVVAGAVVLFSAGLAWWATLWMVRERGRAELLETEARHLREMSQAAAGLAHETRNPLGLIRGWTQRLAQTGIESDAEQRQAQAVVEECDRVTARINQFLAFAKPIEPAPEPVDVDLLIDQLGGLLEPDLEAKGLALAHCRLKPPAVVEADREMLRQALFNLVANAVQFAGEGETVEISVQNGQDGGFRIEVADRGPGVPPDKVDSLFTPYFTTRSSGTGLGLAITKRIAAAHGWQLGYRERPAGGSIFWLDRIHGA
jgi:signal transduction histidine kinase